MSRQHFRRVGCFGSQHFVEFVVEIESRHPDGVDGGGGLADTTDTVLGGG